MSRRAVELVFVSTVAIVEAVVAGLLVTRSHQDGAGVVTGMAAVGAGLSFVVSGLIALHRRPENKTGLYLAAVGYLWLLGSSRDAADYGELIPACGARGFVPKGELSGAAVRALLG